MEKKMKNCEIKSMNWLMKIWYVFAFWIRTYSKKAVDDLLVKCRVSENNVKDLQNSKTSNLNRIKGLEAEKVSLVGEVEKLQLEADQAQNFQDTTVSNLRQTVTRLEEELEATKTPEEESVVDAPNAEETESGPVPDSEEVQEEQPEPTPAKPVVTGNNGRKLDCPKIKAARVRIANGETLTDIAEEYNVSVSTLDRAVDGKTYKECVEPKEEEAK